MLCTKFWLQYVLCLADAAVAVGDRLNAIASAGQAFAEKWFRVTRRAAGIHSAVLSFDLPNHLQATTHGGAACGAMSIKPVCVLVWVFGLLLHSAR